MDNRLDNILLAVETGVACGSASLFRGGFELSSLKISDAGSTRSEDLTSAFDRLLTEAELERTNISKIAVSTGPGSFTGLRAGIASCLGFSRGLGLETVGIPLFDAVASTLEGAQEFVLAVPIGKNDIAWRWYPRDNVTTAESNSRDVFNAFLANCRNVPIYMSADLIEQCHASAAASSFVPLRENLSSYIGEFAVHSSTVGDLTPIYLSRGT